MKSVGEVMAIGRTFKESLQKALRGLETGRFGLGCDSKDLRGTAREPKLHEITSNLATANPERVLWIRYGLLAGLCVDQIHALTGIDPWFLANIEELISLEERLRQFDNADDAGHALLYEAKQNGYSDRQLATLWNSTETEVRRDCRRRGIRPVFKLVDTCAAEFEAVTPYYYSTYESEDEACTGEQPRVVILGGGPNRIGQGIEFDYCCCQAAFALQQSGYEVVMVNSNPETVSTDYDTSDRLFFEPLTVEDVLNVCDSVKPMGVIVQFGGQTPLNLARALETSGVPIIGTSPESIELAEDRERFRLVIDRLGLKQPPSASATCYEEARLIAQRIGYPVVVRPSFVLGGRAMEIVYDERSLDLYMANAVEASPEHAILIDKFLEDAIEIDVDAVCDGKRTIVAGVMEHIEEAGIHSGDSACAIPPFSLPHETVEEIKKQTIALAENLEVRGLMNIQFAVKEGQVYILEVNPRASRTVPFVSKATGLNIAQAAARVMVGISLEEQGHHHRARADVCVGQGGRLPVRQVPRRRHRPGARNAIDRRGHGHCDGLSDGVRQEPARHLERAAHRGDDPDQRCAAGPARNRADRAAAGGAGFNLLCTAGTAQTLEENGIDVESYERSTKADPTCSIISPTARST